LEEKIEKISEIDNQNHIYQKTSLISKTVKLHPINYFFHYNFFNYVFKPSYLIVQMMRFFWKKSSGLPGSESAKAKILRVSSKTNYFFSKLFK